ncbi:MAG: hypothetical protein ABIR91_04900, partial [Candidatus Saccharimonadales bacterium]
MVTIKETAGKIILYFYQLQRVDPIGMGSRQLAFIGKKDGGLALTSDKKWLTGNLLDIGASSTDVYNAFTYLTDKDFIRSKERVSATARVYVEIQLTSSGIDIIEGIERGHAGKQDFYTAFNMQV